MFKNYVRLAFRNFWKNKTYLIVNTLGLGLSIACCIIAYLNQKFNKDFDIEHVNASSIYRINSVHDFNGNRENYGVTPIPLGTNLHTNEAKINAVIDCVPTSITAKIEDEVFNAEIAYVGEQFFEVFTFNILEGSEKSLQYKSSLFLSDKEALKLFGTIDLIGKTVTLKKNKFVEEFEIAGIFEQKQLNSSFGGIQMITLIDNYFDLEDKDRENWASFIPTFVFLEDPNDLDHITKSLNDQYLEPQNKSRNDFQVSEYFLEPFTEMAARSQDTQAHWFRSSIPPSAVVGPIVMSALLLLVACFNFANTSIAVSGNRLKEIGVRKVLGSLRKQLVIQFLVESTFLTLMGLSVGVLISGYFVPAYSSLWPFLDIELSFVKNPELIIFLFFMLLFTVLVAGGYPSFYISKFRPVTVLKGNLKLKSGNWFTRTLLILQYAFSIIAVIVGFIFVENARFQERLNVGYDRDGVVYVEVNDENQYQSFKNTFENDSRIKSVAGSQSQMYESYSNDPVKFEDKEFETDILRVGYNYIETIGLNVLKGRSFRNDSEQDLTVSIVINQKFADQLGIEDPLGAKIVWQDSLQLYVIGVVQNMYTRGLWAPIEPTMIKYSPEEKYRYISIQANPKELKEINELMKSHWKELFPNEIYASSYLNEQFIQASLVNDNILIIFIIQGIVALLLSATGLYSLVSLNIIRRMKEIGVRKVLGATIFQIIKSINSEAVLILAISMGIGSVGAYFMANLLMGSIWEYHVTPGAGAFLLGMIATSLVTAATIGNRVLSAANQNPTVSLRSE
ncbi:MAG: FtsX-like permease family protein [Bacteroidota bacterium]